MGTGKVNIEDLFNKSPGTIADMVHKIGKSVQQSKTEQQLYLDILDEINKENLSLKEKFKLAKDTGLPKSFKSEVTQRMFYLTGYETSKRLSYTLKKQ